MKIYESWKRNTPDTVSGENITVTITYSSFDKGEIDELEKTMKKKYARWFGNYGHGQTA